MLKRLRLRRGDGEVYLDRWGWRTRWFGIYLHRMTAPDPGVDLHDHPWPFVSLILRGGYIEERADVRTAHTAASFAESWPDHCERGHKITWMPGTIHRVRVDECHRIIGLRRVPTWTLVFTGRRYRNWGFYEPGAGGFKGNVPYSTARRDLYAEDIGS